LVITVTQSARSPYFNMVIRNDDGFSKIVLGAGETRRRQDAPLVFDMTTVAYVARASFILEHTGLFSGRVKSVIVPKERALDIDDAIDFKIAEVLYKP
jgi:CMP-N-acetylneuraminic acid synthetase